MKNSVLQVCVFTSFLLISFALSAQREANTWYFGNGAGISFNDQVKALTDGLTRTRFGTSCISNPESGELLFYTDGQKVYNRNHKVMAGGADLSGSADATQPALIVPRPGYPTRYYIFNIKAGENYTLEYSEVNMEALGGLGEVIPSSKNKVLLSNIRPKLTATRHANGRDFWLVTQLLNTNKFQVVLLSPDGISQPRQQAIGTLMDVGNWNQEGFMKFSVDGSRLAHVLNGNILQVDVFAFDKNTGNIGEGLIIDELSVPFGVEFSPSGRFLYISELNSGSWPFPQFGGISQYDLKAADIKSSRTVLVQSDFIGYGSLQLGPDGRIYCGKENGPDDGMDYLSVIEMPDQKGKASKFTDNGLYLEGKKGRIGLPAFVPSLIKTSHDFTVSDGCGKSCRQFFPDVQGKYDKILWEIKGSASKETVILEEVQPSYQFPVSGHYTIKMKVHFPFGWDSISKEIDIADISYSKFNLPDFIDGRKIIKQATVEITSPLLELYVWDQQKEDGDRISLIINGEWVVTDYTVVSEKKKFQIALTPNSDNYLILYAHNLGDDPPNTAAVSYFDGTYERVLTLKSDMDMCGAIRFMYK